LRLGQRSALYCDPRELVKKYTKLNKYGVR
jgi:hypothetical protein